MNGAEPGALHALLGPRRAVNSLNPLELSLLVAPKTPLGGGETRPLSVLLAEILHGRGVVVAEEWSL